MLKLGRPEWNKDSPHKYGIITLGEVAMMDSLLLGIKQEFGGILCLEIGVAGGATMAGILERADEIDCPCFYEGVSNEKDRPQFMPDDCKYHSGDSAEVFHEVSGTFNLLFIDGCHCVNHCMLDFLHYSPSIELGGYCLFHDTRDTDWQGKWYQGHGPRIPEFSIGIRAGLKKLGLLQGYRSDWKLVQEVADTDSAGMILFKKTKHL